MGQFRTGPSAGRSIRYGGYPQRSSKGKRPISPSIAFHSTKGESKLATGPYKRSYSR